MNTMWKLSHYIENILVITSTNDIHCNAEHIWSRNEDTKIVYHRSCICLSLNIFSPSRLYRSFSFLIYGYWYKLIKIEKTCIINEKCFLQSEHNFLLIIKLELAAVIY